MKTEAQIRRVLSDLYERTSGTPLPSGTVRKFLTGWIERKAIENAGPTAARYREPVNRFLLQLAARADLDLAYLTSTDLHSFRDAELKRVSVSTANYSLKVIRIALNQARREGLIQSNPAAQVSSVRQTRGDGVRRPFTLPELKQLLSAADDEWKGMIAFGVYTGQRLSDIALLTWANIDLQRAELRLVTRKTGRRQIIPLAEPLIQFLLRQSVEDNPKTPVFPRAHAILQKHGRAGVLSNQFYELLVAAGFATARPHQKRIGGGGRASRRITSELSFHSLRHTATSLLKNAGVSQAVAMEFIGHESEAISRQYTHIETESLRGAAGKLPNIFNHG